MKNLRNILVTIFATALVVLMHSCASSADDYLKFTEGGAISYVGKVDSLKVLPGRNRVKVEGLIISDPKVSEMRVYWNANKDSIVVPIIRSSGIDEVSVYLENLPENIYNFEVKTFDAKGNSSISQNINAQTYGERYQNSILNRVVLKNSLIKTKLSINFVALSSDSGALGSEIIYTNAANEQKTVFADVKDLIFTINDYKDMTGYRYRSLYKPEVTAVDTFYTSYNAFDPIVSIACDFYTPTQTGANIFTNPTFAGTFDQSGFSKGWTQFDPKSTENFCSDNVSDTSGSLYLRGGCYIQGGVLEYVSSVAIIPNHRYQIKAMIKNSTAADDAFNFVLPNAVWNKTDNDGSGNNQHIVGVPNSSDWVQFDKIITAGPNASGGIKFLFMSCDGLVGSSNSDIIRLDNLEIYDLGL